MAETEPKTDRGPVPALRSLGNLVESPTFRSEMRVGGQCKAQL